MFTGDASGRKDVTSALRSFLERHDGDHVALARKGTYKVTTVEFTARNLTVDFRGSRLRGTQSGVHGVLRIHQCRDRAQRSQGLRHGLLVDPSYQQEHGIQIDGGSDITLNHPIVRSTRGDGIYVGYQAGLNRPAMGVVINRPNIERASRNGIAPVAGEVTIRGGHIAYTGLFGIDFEANDDRGAKASVASWTMSISAITATFRQQRPTAPALRSPPAATPPPRSSRWSSRT